ncbi:MAG: hypothetical protein QOD86_2156 [Miltoncostaeaceae bacterium]|nr:hypothetical protein [Miltoncostaeaceae bacterium]
MGPEASDGPAHLGRQGLAQLIASALARPAERRLREGGPARLLGAVRGALHLGLEGFVVSVTARPVPLMANAVGLAAPSLDLAGLAEGMPVRIAGGAIAVGTLRIAWADAPVWDPAVPVVDAALDPSALPGPEGLELAATDVGARGIALLRTALAERDPGAAGEAAEALIGRGPGLTPEGDDLLAGAAIGARALGRVAVAEALCPADAEARTSAVSATLLRLAAAGAAPEPVVRLLGGADPVGAVAELLGLGRSTGRAIAAGLGLAMGAP